jgi:oxygen-independent coproporphyrinogen-3 oxidase
MSTGGAPLYTTISVTGVYISVPFCEQKCTYCNFSSDVLPKKWIAPYLEALRAEIAAAEFPGEPDTLYLGGGTPSLLAVDELASVLETLAPKAWREATIEASPCTITREKAEGWVKLGIGRVSLGVQSFVPREASATGRKHTPEQVEEEIATLRAAGITAVNVDLIAGLAHQTVESWEASLDWVARLAPEHVSVYMLEVDDDSRLGEELRNGGSRYGAAHVPSDDAIAGFYRRAVERLAAMSIQRYEISNFARPGFESLHNLKYWSMEPYLGFGADAHSFDGRRRWANIESTEEYLERFGRGEAVRSEPEVVEAARHLEDRLMTGLRLTVGVAVSPEETARYEDRLRKLAAQGWLEQEGGRLRLTAEGVMFSNTVLEELLLR